MRIRTPRELGGFVRHTRRRKGLTQASLADRAGVTRRWLSDLESGKASVEMGLVLATLDALGVALEVTEAPASSDGFDLDSVLADLDHRDSGPSLLRWPGMTGRATDDA